MAQTKLKPVVLDIINDSDLEAIKKLSHPRDVAENPIAREITQSDTERISEFHREKVHSRCLSLCLPPLNYFIWVCGVPLRGIGGTLCNIS